MEEQKIDLNSLVVIEQLPKIRETLGVISDEIDREIETALSLKCTEENKTIVKKYRANLNKIKNDLEDRRKQVKEQIMSPYLQFESVYNELVKDKLTNADKTLKERIDTIEITQREEKIKELLDFANEYIKFYGLESVVEAKQVIPNVTLTKSQKSLKDEIKGQLERIANDIKIIQLEEYGNDILACYINNGFGYTKAKLQVVEHEIQKEKVGAMIFTRDSEEEQWKPLVEEEITAPKEIVEEELIECTFTVNATKEQLLRIKEFLQEIGVKYE